MIVNLNESGTGPLVVALNGSERPDGNTAQVLSRVADLAAEHGVRVQIVDLRAMAISDCASCGDCNTRLEPCALGDDVSDIVQAMVEADGIIYACPVHGYGTSSIMQRFIERAGVGYLRFDRPLVNKVAGVIVTGRRYAHMDVYSQLMHNAMLNRMIIVGSGYPAIVFGGSPGKAIEDEEGMAAVAAMVLRMIEMIKFMRMQDDAATAIEAGTLNEREFVNPALPTNVSSGSASESSV